MNTTNMTMIETWKKCYFYYFRFVYIICDITSTLYTKKKQKITRKLYHSKSSKLYRLILYLNTKLNYILIN